jgi:hypothetical protein
MDPVDVREARLALERSCPAFDAFGRRLRQFDDQGEVISPASATQCQLCQGESAHVHHWQIACPLCHRHELVTGPGVYKWPHMALPSHNICRGSGYGIEATLDVAHLIGGS